MQVMQRIQPHIVFIELFKNRLGILQLDEQRLLEESKSINFQKFQQSVQKVILTCKITPHKLSALVAGTFIFKIFKMRTVRVFHNKYQGETLIEF